MRRRDLNQLTDREREVLELLRRDFTNEQIAQRLGISSDGAKYHVSQILSKLGVATREEAASWRAEERRRWWARWPLWAKVAGAATVAAATATLTAVALGALQSGESEDVLVGPTQAPQASEVAPTPVDTPVNLVPFGPSVIGSYEDVNGFRSFAAQIDGAIRDRNIQWFVDNTRFVDFRCDQGGFPARPRACGEAITPQVIPAVIIGILSSEGYGADRAEYEQFLSSLFNEFDAAASDGFGDGRPRLYSLGVLTPGSRAPSTGLEEVDAVMTSIPQEVPAGTEFVQSLRRIILEFHAVYDGERWIVGSLSYGRDPGSLAINLDPAGEGTKVDSGGPFWVFWQRWETTPTP